ncbi:unnamed protein product, partial [Tetraodon nigroviridis]
IPGPLQGDGQDFATILHFVQNLIHEEEGEKDKTRQCSVHNVGEQGQMALLGHSLAAYISVLDRERLRKLTTRIQSDTTLWLCRLFRVNLATLALSEINSTIMAATRCDSMTLTPGQWLGLPAVTAVTLYRHEDPALSLAAGLTSSQPVAKLRALPLWLSLQYLGHNGIVEKIKHA